MFDMKKKNKLGVTLGLSAVLLLAACGSGEQTNKQQRN